MADHETRPTDAPYGAEESEAILKAIAAGQDPPCPRCGGRLERSRPSEMTKSMFRVSLVRCPACRRAVFHAGYGAA
jgi:ssDNA-binding Zn-finger/Zn-ribbon topoisomerase 1